MSTQRSFPEPGVLDPGDQFWLEAMADAVLILSPVYGPRRQVTDFRVDYANAAATELTDDPARHRLRPGSLVGTGFLNLDDEPAGALITALRDVLASDVPCAIDGLHCRILRTDTWIEQARDVRISRHGNRLLVTLRDVTEREESEQGIRSSEKSLRALVDGVFDEALMTVDPAGNVLSWNTGANRIFGYTAAEMIGRHYSVLYPRGRPVSRPVENLAAVAERLHEAWQVRKDGRRFWASVSITAMHGDNGELRGFFSVTRDLTEQSEQRLRDLHFSLVRALTDCADVDKAADTILELTTFTLGATFSEMFIARQEQGRPDSTSRHAVPRSTLDVIDVAAGGAAGPLEALIARVRTTGALVIVSDLDQLGTSAQVTAAVALGVRSAIACPIVTAAGIAGVLAYFFEALPALRRAPRRPSPRSARRQRTS